MTAKAEFLTVQETLKKHIRDIPDFPKPGIVFKDITPLLAAPEAMRQAFDAIADRYRGAAIDVVIGTEARGFIFGPPVADRLGVGFVPIRKPGKLPFRTRRASYDLEYGSDSIEIHEDAVHRGQRCLMLDDLLATGGTMEACCKLVESLGGAIAGCAFLIELSFLKGRERLRPYDIHSLIQYDRE